MVSQSDKCFVKLLKSSKLFCVCFYGNIVESQFTNLHLEDFLGWKKDIERVF